MKFSWVLALVGECPKMRKRKYTALEPSASPCADASMPDPIIHNIVSTAQIEGSVMPLDLTRISLLLPGSSYDKRRFAAMTLRLANPACTVLLFSSGKMVITGGRNLYDCMLSALTVTNLLRKILSGVHFQLKSCDIQNIVAHCEIPLGAGSLDLNLMYERLNLFSTYQKNMFPGLIYRPPASPIVLLCFDSGKIVITGGKTVPDIFKGWAILWPTVKQFISGG